MRLYQIQCCADFTSAANSGGNCVTVFDSQLQSRELYPTTARWDISPGEQKNSHFNSVHMRDRIVYVVAHNYDRYSAVWLLEWPGFALVNVIPTRADGRTMSGRSKTT